MIKFTDMYLEFVRPQAILVARSVPEVKSFVMDYVTKIDGAIYQKDTRSACTYAMQWQDDMKNDSLYTSLGTKQKSLSILKNFVDQLVCAPF